MMKQDQSRSLRQPHFHSVREVDRAAAPQEQDMHHCMVSDGTRQSDGLLAFAGCESGAGGWIGRVHVPGTSYESEVAGLLENLRRIGQLPGVGVGEAAWPWDCSPVSDCRSVLYSVRSALCRPRPCSRSCLVAAAPLFCFARHHCTS